MDKHVAIQKLDHFDESLGFPSYKTPGAAGADVKACLGSGKSIVIAPGERAPIPTGLAFEIPPGFEIQVRPRSGLSLNTSLMIVNAPGTIDSDYRGEVKILLGNMGKSKVTIHHGDRLAQFVLSPIIQANFITKKSLTASERGKGGFGSTGIQ